MDKQLEKNLSALTEFLTKAMSQAYDLSKQEVPVFVKEYLAWYFYSNLFDIITFSILLIIGSIVSYKLFKKASVVSKQGHDPFGYQMAGGCIGIITVILILPVMEATSNCIKVSIAPRIVLLEEVKHLTN